MSLLPIGAHLLGELVADVRGRVARAAYRLAYRAWFGAGYVAPEHCPTCLVAAPRGSACACVTGWMPVGEDSRQASGSAASDGPSNHLGVTSAQGSGAGREAESRAHDLGPGCYCRACGKFDPSGECSGVMHDWNQSLRGYVARETPVA